MIIKFKFFIVYKLLPLNYAIIEGTLSIRKKRLYTKCLHRPKIIYARIKLSHGIHFSILDIWQLIS